MALQSSLRVTILESPRRNQGACRNRSDPLAFVRIPFTQRSHTASTTNGVAILSLSFSIWRSTTTCRGFGTTTWEGHKTNWPLETCLSCSVARQCIQDAHVCTSPNKTWVTWQPWRNQEKWWNQFGFRISDAQSGFQLPWVLPRLPHARASLRAYRRTSRKKRPDGRSDQLGGG